MPSGRRRLRLTPEADADIESLLQYTIETWGDAQMRRYSASLFATLDRLVTFPEMGR